MFEGETVHYGFKDSEIESKNSGMTNLLVLAPSALQGHGDPLRLRQLRHLRGSQCRRRELHESVDPKCRLEFNSGDA